MGVRTLLISGLAAVTLVVLHAAVPEIEKPDEGNSLIQNSGLVGLWQLREVKGAPYGKGAVIDKFALEVTADGKARYEIVIDGKPYSSLAGEFLAGNRMLAVYGQDALISFFEYNLSGEDLTVRPADASGGKILLRRATSATQAEPERKSGK